MNSKYISLYSCLLEGFSQHCQMKWKTLWYIMSTSSLVLRRLQSPTHPSNLWFVTFPRSKMFTYSIAYDFDLHTHFLPKHLTASQPINVSILLKRWPWHWLPACHTMVLREHYKDRVLRNIYCLIEVTVIVFFFSLGWRNRSCWLILIRLLESMTLQTTGRRH